MIATVFGTLAIIAFVPGLGLYRCMSLLAQGNTSLGLQTGIVAMSNIVMITFGLGVGSFLMRMIFGRPVRAETPRRLSPPGLLPLPGEHGKMMLS